MIIFATSEFMVRYLTKSNDQEIEKYIKQIEENDATLYLPMVSMFQTWEKLKQKGIGYHEIARIVVKMVRSGYIKLENNASLNLIKEVSYNMLLKFEHMNGIEEQYMQFLEKELDDTEVEIPWFPYPEEDENEVGFLERYSETKAENVFVLCMNYLQTMLNEEKHFQQAEERSKINLSIKETVRFLNKLFNLDTEGLNQTLTLNKIRNFQDPEYSEDYRYGCNICDVEGIKKLNYWTTFYFKITQKNEFKPIVDKKKVLAHFIAQQRIFFPNSEFPEVEDEEIESFYRDILMLFARTMANVLLGGADERDYETFLQAFEREIDSFIQENLNEQISAEEIAENLYEKLKQRTKNDVFSTLVNEDL